MKKVLAVLLAVLILMLCACTGQAPAVKTDTVLATTAPVAEIVSRLLDGTGVAADQLITEAVSCLHDYSFSVEQMKKVESCSLVVTSGLGLEDFMGSVLKKCSDSFEASYDVSPLPGEDGVDPHVWMAPENMIVMVRTVSGALQVRYPDQAQIIFANEDAYCKELEELNAYGKQQLAQLSCRKLVTFHDGFAYFADAFDLEIAAAMEIEPGSEPSAKQLEAIIDLVHQQSIPAVFQEVNGTTDCAELVSRESGAAVYTLNMAMSLGSETYADVMKRNIDTIKEALG